MFTSQSVIGSSTFWNDSVTVGFGGSICALDVGIVMVSKCSFILGTSFKNRGSISVVSESTLNIQDSIVTRSHSNHQGGGIFLNDKSFLKADNLSVVRSSSGTGGGIYCEDSNIDIRDGNVDNNTALTNG